MIQLAKETRRALFIGVVLLLSVVWLTWPRTKVSAPTVSTSDLFNTNQNIRDDTFDRMAAPLALVDTDGQDVTVTAADRPAVALVFWRTDCVKCEQELAELSTATDAKTGTIYAVNVGETAEAVRAFLKDHPQKVRVILDPQRLSSVSYNTAILPSTTFLHFGKVVGYGTGLLSSDQLIEKLRTIGQLE